METYPTLNEERPRVYRDRCGDSENQENGQHGRREQDSECEVEEPLAEVSVR